ncbi:MAG TPA: hypothetical protein VLW45_10320 [Pelomicrobium sp.]|nr:hypothetical protein [Pelomicrobium sp.]
MAFLPGFILIAGLAVAPAALACTPFIEEHPSGTTASFRPHTTALKHCEVDEPTYRRVVSAWLAGRPADAPPVSALFVGRSVSFPWLSRQIADSALASPDWAERVARAKPGERDRLGGEILRDPALLRRLAAPFESTRYAAVRLSYEKILFGRADEHTSNRRGGAVMVPFDAQLWLQLAPRD